MFWRAEPESGLDIPVAEIEIEGSSSDRIDVEVTVECEWRKRNCEELVDEIKSKGIEQTEFEELEQAVPETDVLYVTRVQKERFEDLEAYDAVKGAYMITPETLKLAKDEMIVMHPLPRVGEISPEIDGDPRAAYFRQMEYGLYLRMALLAMVLGKA